MVIINHACHEAPSIVNVARNHLEISFRDPKFTLSEFLTANIPKIGQSMAPMYDDVEYVDMRFRAK